MENLASVTSSARILSGASSAHLAISSGKHACAIMKANRGLRCWGSGGLGQLGVNTYYRSVPPQTDVGSSHSQRPSTISANAAVVVCIIE
jgi:hypothetical protein